MNTNYDTFWREKKDFCQNHDSDYTVCTSPMDEYGRWHKTYLFTDGAVWSELMTPEFETAYTEVHGVRVEVEVKMLKTEYWSTEQGSKYYWEKF